jgi:hypothetical protein
VDLTEEQWAFVGPIFPEKETIQKGVRGRPYRDPRDVLNGVLGYCAQARRGWTYLPGTRRTRRATGGFRAGSATAR